MKKKANRFQDDESGWNPKNPVKNKSTKNVKRKLFKEIEEEEDLDFSYKKRESLEDYFDDEEDRDIEDEEEIHGEDMER